MLVNFLLHAGVDLEHRDLTGWYAPDNQATLIQLTLPSSASYSMFREVTRPTHRRNYAHYINGLNTEAIYAQANYTSLHLIVSGLLALDLATELSIHPELLDQKDEHGATPLHLAISHDNLDAVHILLFHGASTCTTESNGDNVFHLCASAYPPVVQLVLDKMDSEAIAMYLRSSNSYGVLPQFLTEKGDVLRMFLEHGAYVAQLDDSRRSHAHCMACPSCNVSHEMLILRRSTHETKIIDDGSDGRRQ